MSTPPPPPTSGPPPGALSPGKGGFVGMTPSGTSSPSGRRSMGAKPNTTSTTANSGEELALEFETVLEQLADAEELLELDPSNEEVQTLVKTLVREMEALDAKIETLIDLANKGPVPLVTAPVELAAGTGGSFAKKQPTMQTLQPERFASILSQGKTCKDGTLGPVTCAYSVEDARSVVDLVTAECTKNTTKEIRFIWEDPDFGQDPSSLDSDSSKEGVEENYMKYYPKTGPWNTAWAPLHKLTDREPELFKDGIESADIKQGLIGNCYFCAAVSAIASRPDKIQRLFYPRTYNPAGIYSFSMWNGFEWFAVLIDDTLPCNSGRYPTLLFGRGVDGDEFWYSLLEKACAKVAGSYQMLIAGNCLGLHSDSLFEMLTGGKVSNMYTDHDGDWYHKMKEYFDKGWVCSTGTKKKKQDFQQGLRTNHAYTPLTYYESPDGKLQLIRVRNTWANTEWEGAYCDKDPIWKEDKALAEACDMEEGAKNDGIFWMPQKDLGELFNIVNFCSFPSDGLKYEKSVEGLVAGGSYNECSKRGERHVLMSIPGGAVVNIRLRFADRKVRSQYGNGFHLYQVPPESANPTHAFSPLPGDSFYRSSGGQQNEITGRLTLPKGGSNQFLIVPSCSFSTSAETSSFSLVVQSKVPLAALIILNRKEDTKQ